MRIQTIADIHIGNHLRFARGTMEAGINRRGRLVLDAFGHVLQHELDEPDAFFIAGDLYDEVRPEPQLLAAGMRLLGDSIEWHNNPEPPTSIIVGNHEQASNLEGDHALGVFSRMARVVEKPQAYLEEGKQDEAGVLVWALPYRTDLRPQEYIESALAEMENRFDITTDYADAILLAHFGVEDQRTPPWLKGGHGSIHADVLHEIAAKAGISCVLAGDWHEHRSWRYDDGIEIVQIGALVPTGFDNPSNVAQLHPDRDPYGSVITWDNSKPKGKRCSRSVVQGPRFVKTKSSAEVEAALDEASDYGHELFVQVTASADAVTAMTRHIEELQARTTMPFHFEVVADHADVRRRIESAAISAKDAETTERAIAEYVFEMPLDEDLDPQEVNRLAQGFSKGGEA
ncbi:MAG: hypothetical protein CL819_15340 [Croceicoccus sp.]|nr:hypothetical protein [Croceicoccus sp.]